ncbi:hypothetical protein MY10362_009820 [Beauveria mimosiformis]
MELDSSGYVSILSLIIFIPTLIANLVVCARHGFNSPSTWFCILFLCVLRISGAICHLLSFSNFSIGLLVAIAVLNSIGLSPLLLATLGYRLPYSGGRKVLNGRIVLLIRLLTIIPLILGVIGAYIVYSDAIRGVMGTPAIMKAAVVISAFAFLAICGAYACTIPVGRHASTR